MYLSGELVVSGLCFLLLEIGKTALEKGSEVFAARALSSILMKFQDLSIFLQKKCEEFGRFLQMKFFDLAYLASTKSFNGILKIGMIFALFKNVFK